MKPRLTDLEQMARQAGELLRLGYEHEHQVRFKSEIDLVTEVDQQSETFILGEIRRLFPRHQIVSEEIGLVQGSTSDQWFIDPLDGTVNYAHGIPIFCVSIAYSFKDVLTLGVVYDPLRDEMFTAERGKGAWCNGSQIHVSGESVLQHSMLATGFPYDSWSTPHNNLDFFGRFARITQGLRRLGSAALDLCYVAAGRLDGYWDLTLSPWDVAAGGLIAAEAGALVTSLDGHKDFLKPPFSVLVAPPILHDQMLKILEDQG